MKRRPIIPPSQIPVHTVVRGNPMWIVKTVCSHNHRDENEGGLLHTEETVVVQNLEGFACLPRIIAV